MNMAELRDMTDNELAERRRALLQEVQMIQAVVRERTYHNGYAGSRHIKHTRGW